MIIRPRRLFCCILLPLFVLLGTSCSRQAAKERALARADAYHVSGELDKAEVEYLNTLKQDPKEARAFAQLGLIYSEQGRIGNAFAYLRKARELQPENVEVRAKLAVFYLATRKLEEARAEARYILEHQPGHPEAPLLLAESAQQPKDVTEAGEFLQKLPTARSASVLTALAGLEFHQRNLSGAETLLKQAQALDPKSPAVNASLGTIYLAQKNTKAAEEAFAAAWQYSPPRSPQKLSYVRFKLQSGDTARARQLLTELTNQVPDCLPPMMMLAEIGAQEKKYDEALSLTEKIMGRDPQNAAAMMLTARLLLAKGEREKNLRMLEKLDSLQPTNPEVHYQFGLTYLAQGDAVKATTSLNHALELAPGYVDAILLLADLNLKKGDAKAAIVTLKPLVARRPELTTAKALLARSYLSQGEFAEALTAYQEISAASPNDPNLLLPLALIYRQQKNYDEARKVLGKILELSPDSPQAIEQLVDLDLMAGKNASARQRAEALKAKQPGNTAAYLLLAKISLAEKNLSEAETELLKVIELQPDASTAYSLLAGIYSQTHQEKKAVSQLEQVALKNPKSPALFMRIALLQERLKDYPAARAAYEKVLALEPKFIPALNNLAYLKAEQLNEAEGGLALAQKARELAPLDPSIADTLGWILFKQGQYQRARPLLVESAAKAPNDATVQFHLGMTYYMMGETDSARVTLQRALQLNPELPEKKLVGERLAILGTDDDQSGPEVREALEKAVAARKDDPVAFTRLGTILVSAGDLDQAQKYLKSALTINPRNVNAALGMIRVHLARHETKPALELAKATRQQAPDDPHVGHQLGRIAFQLGDYQWAASLLLESAQKLPDDMNVLFDRAKAAYSIGRVTEAEEALRHIQQSQPLFPGTAEVSRYLEMISLTSNLTPDASARIDQSLKADPTFVPALMALGANAEKQSNADAARQAYERALAQYPDFTPAKRNLILLASAANASEPKTYDQAVQVREAFPNDPDVAQALGILTYRKGDYSRAISLLKESISKLGENARNSFYLGMAQYRTKDRAARTTLQHSLDLGLKDEPAAEARRTLAEIK